MFLAALAPELCTVSGPSLERFRTVAEAMGLARVVRSMEILGHALVDMREAPDAQVVLEIAVVRAVRPDLDSGMEALSERVSVLERAQSGAAAFPRPGTPAERRSAAGDDRGAARRRGVPPEPTAAPSARRGGPQALHRCDAAQQGGGRAAIVAARGGARVRGSGTRCRCAVGTAGRGGAAACHRRPVQPERPVETARPIQSVPAPVVTLDRDSLTEAWGDGILQSLPARAKARYASGRFVAVDEQGAHFALPNAAHRDQCTEQKALVEEALTNHFGTKVTLVLQIDDAAPAAAPRADSARPVAGPPRRRPPPPADDVEDMDPHDLMDDPSSDQASDAEARLLQAFPGASEVPG